MRRFVPAKSIAMQMYFGLRQRAFDHLARKMDRYILHSPNYLLFEHAGPRVCTVHDLSWLHYPEFHPKERVHIMQQRMPRSLEIADAVITDSEFVRREVIEQFGIDSRRVHAVPLGVSDSFRPRNELDTHSNMQRLGLRHGRYLLALATLEPRKNLGRLLDAYESLEPALRIKYPLVLAGGIGWHASSLVERLDRLVARGEVKRLGFVDEESLPYILAGARALAFPSIYEGFGLPPLEAMASGIPVMASSSSCMFEVTGNAATLVDPLDVGSMSDALSRVLEDEAWRQLAIERGLARAGTFTWERCLDATVDIYKSVAEGSPPCVMTRG
jgi:alpha-1,3-rhamnosyl/mannosyltransferase